MPLSPDDAAHSPGRKTLAELICRFPDPILRAQLEKFRVTYEAEFGETDLTRRYTSTLPTEDQDWLLKHHPKRYFDGLPPFVQSFIKEKMDLARRTGKLDDAADEFLYLFISGQMELGGTSRGR